MIDLYDIIEKSLDRGHTVVIVDDVVTLYPKEETEKPVKVEPNPELKPKKPKRGGMNKKDLDMGKVRALRDANWTLEQIAEEMGCAASTIMNHLKEVES